MNVPLKKRYNYCAIDNNENSTGSINFTNGKRAISKNLMLILFGTLVKIKRKFV